MKKILFIDIIFPLLTGTFVYREVVALQKAGHIITTVAIAKPDVRYVHQEAAHFLETTFYLENFSILKKIWVQPILIVCNFTKWMELFKIALKEKEIKGLSDRLRLIYHFFLAGYIYKNMKDQNFDHIHAPFLTSCATVAFFLSRYFEIPFSFTMHATNIYVNPIMLGRKIKDCKACITISDYNKKYLIKKYGSQFEHKIKIIHCGINPSEFVPSREKKLGLPVILSVGQLTERKGFIYLLQAIKILKQKNCVFVCKIVGDGEENKKLVQKTAELDISDKVIFMGRQTQETVRKLLENASIFCLPSIITESGGREGIPVALMEAMAMELPVVSTNTVGIPELVENEKGGLLVKEKDPESLAGAIERLLKDEKLRKSLGEYGRNKVIKDFNIKNTAILYEKILN